MGPNPNLNGKRNTLYDLPGSIKLLDWKTGVLEEVVDFESGPIAVKRFGSFLVVMLRRELVWFDLESKEIKRRQPIGSDWQGVGNLYFEISPSGKTARLLWHDRRRANLRSKRQVVTSLGLGIYLDFGCFLKG